MGRYTDEEMMWRLFVAVFIIGIATGLYFGYILWG
jgi:hypothetical protein